jgi:hypothetical protein
MTLQKFGTGDVLPPSDEDGQGLSKTARHALAEEYDGHTQTVPGQDPVGAPEDTQES